MRRKAKDKKLCKACGRHRAVFLFRGRVRADRDHDLCPRCYRSQLDRLFAMQMIGAAEAA